MRKKVGVMAIRGVPNEDKRSLLRIAVDEGMYTISALMRSEIKKIIKARKKGQRKAA